MSLLALAEATADGRWSRVGLVLWAWFCGFNFAVCASSAAGAALTGRLPSAAFYTWAAYGWLCWASGSARRAAG